MIILRTTTLRRSRTGCWQARKAIPEAIRPSYAKLYGQGHEAKFSRPSYVPEVVAKRDFAVWHAEVETRFASLRAASYGAGVDLTHRQAHALAGDWYRAFVARHEESPGSAINWALHKEMLLDAIAQRAPVGAGSTEMYQARYQAMAEKAASWWGLDAFLMSKGVILSEAGKEAFYVAASIELEAALDLMERRAGGDYAKDTRPQQHPTYVPSEVNAQAPVLPKLGSERLPSDLFREYVQAVRPAGNTVRTWGTVFKTLDERFPSHDLSTITEEEAFQWRQSLRDKRKEDGSPSMTETSVHKCYVSAARTVWAWAITERRGGLKANPFLALKPRTDKRVDKVRNRERSFKDTESKVILVATFADHSERKYGVAITWVPRLCAYNGARVGEMSQLRKEDVVEFEGSHFLRITPEAGTVKDREVRTVPIHEHLISMGFLEFVKAAPAGPLFYCAEEVHKRRGGPSNDPLKPSRPAFDKVIEAIGEWVREVGVTDPDIRPSHAWRHTFKRIARAAGIEPGIRDAFCGHAGRTAGEDYEALEGDEGMRVLAKAIKQFPRYAI